MVSSPAGFMRNNECPSGCSVAAPPAAQYHVDDRASGLPAAGTGDGSSPAELGTAVPSKDNASATTAAAVPARSNNREDLNSHLRLDRRAVAPPGARRGARQGRSDRPRPRPHPRRRSRRRPRPHPRCRDVHRRRRHHHRRRARHRRRRRWPTSSCRDRRRRRAPLRRERARPAVHPAPRVDGDAIRRHDATPTCQQQHQHDQRRDLHRLQQTGDRRSGPDELCRAPVVGRPLLLPPEQRAAVRRLTVDGQRPTVVGGLRLGDLPIGVELTGEPRAGSGTEHRRWALQRHLCLVAQRDVAAARAARDR